MAATDTSGVPYRYASALFELAQDADALEGVEADVSAMQAMIDESADLRRLIKSPVFSADDQLRAVSAVLDKAELTGLVGNFVKLAARNRRLFAIPDMLTAFNAILANYRGEIVASVTSAEPLSDERVEELRAALAEKAGGTIKLETKVDPGLIGGLIVQLGSQMIDTSLRTRLEGVRRAMKEAA
ncbi:MAG: F0F1 ATP synthase subunit delta [Pseudomonadota bacterium]